MVFKRSDGFAARESGAAAFDWVILAVGVFGLGLAVYSVFTADLEDRPPARPPGVERPAPPEPDIAPLYPYFDADWHRDQTARIADLDDAALRDRYRAQYGAATGDVNARIAVDFLVIIEAEMARRNLPLPDGHVPAAEIRARLSGAEALP